MKARSIDEAKREASECTRCTSVSNAAFIPLVKGRTQVVYGVGPPNADLVFIGEAPGEDEDEKGEPTPGRTRQLRHTWSTVTNEWEPRPPLHGH